MKQAKMLFLGTGASTGVPVLGCHCAVCRSSSTYNKRYRVSGCIRIGEKSFLLDAGPDFRLQAFRAGITQIDGLLLTHTHYDHIAGLDDLRPLCFYRKDPIPCLLSQESLDELKLRYHYLMREYTGLEVPYTKLDFQILEEDFGSVQFGGLTWHYLSYSQMGMKVTGYILGNLAYILDIRDYQEEVITRLQGIEHLVLGALHHASSQGHFNIEEAIDFARKVGAKKTYLSHLSHQLNHEEDSKNLPKGVCLAYDGLEIAFKVNYDN